MSKNYMGIQSGPATYKRPDEVVDRITPAWKLFILAHLGVPEVRIEDWSLTVDGLVDNPTVFEFTAIKDNIEKITIETVLKCSGSPRKPTTPTRQVANVVWGGALLPDVLGRVGTRDDAAFFSLSTDRFGEFRCENGFSDCWECGQLESQIDVDRSFRSSLATALTSSICSKFNQNLDF